MNKQKEIYENLIGKLVYDREVGIGMITDIQTYEYVTGAKYYYVVDWMCERRVEYNQEEISELFQKLMYEVGDGGE